MIVGKKRQNYDEKLNKVLEDFLIKRNVEFGLDNIIKNSNNGIQVLKVELGIFELDQMIFDVVNIVIPIHFIIQII